MGQRSSLFYGRIKIVAFFVTITYNDFMETLSPSIEAYLRHVQADSTLRGAKQEEWERLAARKRFRDKVEAIRAEFLKPNPCDRIDEYSSENLDHLRKGTPETIKAIFSSPFDIIG